VVKDLRRGPEPWFVLTGDTLFVGAVGRPDLPGHAEENAATLYDSLHDKLLALPDDVEVYPAHFAGSACGAGMSGKPASSIGFEKRWNPMLQLSKSDLVAAPVDVPPKPAEMASIMMANQGRAPED
jgi:glyoxylase-like metal-dependent hydrolase (beta-lactamase superfamily II)